MCMACARVIGLVCVRRLASQPPQVRQGCINAVPLPLTCSLTGCTVSRLKSINSKAPFPGPFPNDVRDVCRDLLSVTQYGLID